MRNLDDKNNGEAVLNSSNMFDLFGKEPIFDSNDTKSYYLKINGYKLVYVEYDILTDKEIELMYFATSNGKKYINDIYDTTLKNILNLLDDEKYKDLGFYGLYYFILEIKKQGIKKIYITESIIASKKDFYNDSLNILKDLHIIKKLEQYDYNYTIYL